MQYAYNPAANYIGSFLLAMLNGDPQITFWVLSALFEDRLPRGCYPHPRDPQTGRLSGAHSEAAS